MGRIYPRFFVKQGLRAAYEHVAPNWLLNCVVGNPTFSSLASTVFFKKKRLK